MNRTKQLAVTALFSAVIAVLSQISIPMPGGVPLTAQTFAVTLTGYMLGPLWGTVSVAVWLTLGCVGAPVFASLKGGISVLAGPTGGFLIGFLATAALCGFGTRKKNVPLAILLGCVGIAVCHVCGILVYAAVTETPILASAAGVSLPYLLKDLLSAVFAYLLCRVLSRRIKPLSFR